MYDVKLRTSNYLKGINSIKIYLYCIHPGVANEVYTAGEKTKDDAFLIMDIQNRSVHDLYCNKRTVMIVREGKNQINITKKRLPTMTKMK